MATIDAIPTLYKLPFCSFFRNITTQHLNQITFHVKKRASGRRFTAKIVIQKSMAIPKSPKYLLSLAKVMLAPGCFSMAELGLTFHP